MKPDLKLTLTRLRWLLALAGFVALGISLLGLWNNPKQFFYSYLVSCLFWVGLSIGCLFVTMILHLTGGRWGYPTRRFLEAGFMTLPLMAVLFIPVFFGMGRLYPWAQPLAIAQDHILQHRQSYQNSGGFIVRTAIFFAAAIWFAWRLRSFSLVQDATTDAAPTRKARFYSGPGLVIFSLLGTFVYVDWIMSLERHWFSTLFAVILLIGDILVAYAFSVMMLVAFKEEPDITGVVTKTHSHHLGNLLLTFVLFWTYLSFGQLLIIYSGDVPQEIDWYLHRIAGGWKWVISALALFHFFVPFFLLLFRPLKRQWRPLACLAALIFFMHLLDAYWLVMPAFHQSGPMVSWLDFLIPAGLGCFWLSFFLSRLVAAPLLPKQDPGMQFAFVYQHGH